MAKAIMGAALLAGAAVLTGGAAGVLGGVVEGALNTSFVAAHLVGVITTLAVSGASMEAGAIADALTSNRGMNIAMRQAVAFRPVILGTQRVGGVIIFRSTTGSKHSYLNYVIVLAGHEVHSIEAMYLDGRRVEWRGSGEGAQVRNGVSFGGWADDDDHTAPDGSTYNFGGNVFATARYGDQQPGDVIGDLTANDPAWAATPDGRSPWCAGLTYVYVHVTAGDQFPGEPEIRFLVNGALVYDPRTQTTGFSQNWALLMAHVAANPVYGLGMQYGTDIPDSWLIASANICDEQVYLKGGGTESRYLCGHQFDMGTAPGDVLQAMLGAAAGRVTCPGGQWAFLPAAYSAPEFEFDESILTGPLQFAPTLSRSELLNEVRGTFTAPRYPYNPDGIYASGWYEGTREDTFGLEWQPQSFPPYARDVAHGYSSSVDLDSDGGKLLPGNVDLRCCLSASQAQRVAKINLMRSRLGFRATMPMQFRSVQMMGCTSFVFSFPRLGLVNRELEVLEPRFSIAPPAGARDERALAFGLEFDVRDTSAEVYEWDEATEEQPMQLATIATPANSPYTVDPPTTLMLTTLSNAGSASGGVGGATSSTGYAVMLTYTPSVDSAVVATEAQYRPHAAASVATGWISGASADASASALTVSDVSKGGSYDFRIRARRSYGAASIWVDTLTAYPSGYTV